MGDAVIRLCLLTAVLDAAGGATPAVVWTATAGGVSYTLLGDDSFVFGKGWTLAYLQCQDLVACLARVRSAADNEALRGFIATRSRRSVGEVWTDVNNLVDAAVFMYSDQRPTLYVNWAAGEPAALQGGVVVLDGRWAVRDRNSLRLYVCQKPCSEADLNQLASTIGGFYETSAGFTTAAATPSTVTTTTTNGDGTTENTGRTERVSVSLTTDGEDERTGTTSGPVDGSTTPLATDTVDIADNTGSTEDSLMTTGGSDSTKPVSEARTAVVTWTADTPEPTTTMTSLTSRKSTETDTAHAPTSPLLTPTTPVTWGTSTERGQSASEELQWNVWTLWTECSRTCGSGQQVRVKLCSYGAHTLCTRRLYTDRGLEIGYGVVTQECNPFNCPQDGVVTNWLTWGDCSATCGVGTKRRWRECVGPFYNGAACPQRLVQMAFCSEDACPANRTRPVVPPGPAYTIADQRPSAIAFGVVGVVSLVVFVAVIVFLDASSIVMKTVGRRQRKYSDRRHSRSPSIVTS